MSDDYKTGYGKPPKEHQFRPNQSGNPKGRPKGSRNKPRILHSDDLRHSYLAAINRAVQVTDNGKTMTLPAIAAIQHQQVQKALSGDRRAAEQVLKNATLAYQVEDAQRLEIMKLLMDKEDAENARFEKMSRYECEMERAKHFKGKKGLRDLFGIKKFPIEAEEPVDDRDWESYHAHLENLRKGKPTQWPPAYWNEQ